MKFRIVVSIQKGVLDPEMSTLERHLERRGEKNFLNLEHRSLFEIDFSPEIPFEEAEAAARALAENYFANPEIHTWTIEHIN